MASSWQIQFGTLSDNIFYTFLHIIYTESFFYLIFNFSQNLFKKF